MHKFGWEICSQTYLHCPLPNVLFFLWLLQIFSLSLVLSNCMVSLMFLVLGFYWVSYICGFSLNWEKFYSLFLQICILSSSLLSSLGTQLMYGRPFEVVQNSLVLSDFILYYFFPHFQFEGFLLLMFTKPPIFFAIMYNLLLILLFIFLSDIVVFMSKCLS